MRNGLHLSDARTSWVRVCNTRLWNVGIAFVVGSAVDLVARRGWLKLQARIPTMARETLPNLPTYLPASLRTLGHPITCPKDGWVFRKGGEVRAVFFVLDGEVRLSRFAKDGSEIALHRAGRGEFFAEAALNTPRYQCNAIASQASTLFAFPAAKVRALLAKDPAFAHEWVALLARQLHAARARLERLALKSAAERVLHYLHTEGKGPRCEVAVAGSVKDLAKELGLTHESLYRTLARLEQAGVVVRSDRRLGLV